MRRAAAVLAAAVLIAGLVALGTWQVQRRAWKLDLIAQVDARLRRSPVVAPGPAEWAGIDADSAQYRRVRVDGRFLPVVPAFVQAATDRGAGWWVLAPVRTARGFTVVVNRGFVSARAAAPATIAHVTGLLRIAEPGGAFLRRNDAGTDRWYSRDVAAIARARGWGVVAPYFVDIDAASSAPGGPVGGLTVIAFPNNHFVYAVTWYALAMMVVVAFVMFVRVERRAP